MPTNYQTLITEVKKTKQDNIKMAPMFKGTPGKEPDQMSLLELLGAAYAILREQDVSGGGNIAMKQWLSGVQVALDTIDSFSPAFPPESVFSAALTAGGDEAMKKLMGDKASLQALGELEERDRKIMSLFAVKVMGATLDLPEKKQRKEQEQERKRAEQEAKEKAEREAKKAGEREAREKAEREAREKAEREAREKAEREAREKKDRELDEERQRLFEELTRDQQPPEDQPEDQSEYGERWRAEKREQLKKTEERLRKLDQRLHELDKEGAELFGKPRVNDRTEDGPKADLNQTVQYDEIEWEDGNRTVYLSEEETRELSKEPEDRFAEQSTHAENAARAAYERKERADMERQAAALLREENLSAGPNKHMKIQNSVQGDPVQCRYYDDALKTALQRAGLTEKELVNNNAARIHKSRSQEFYNVVYCAAMARDSIRQDDGQSMGGYMKGVADHCIKYLKKYPKVRSTQSGRDSYELALNLLALSANPDDPDVRECIDKVNAARGAKPGTKNFIDLGDYGPDRLLGRKVPAGEYMKDVDKRIAEQLKRSKDKSLAPDDAIKAKYEAIRLKMEKLYLKTAVTPSKAVYPDRIAEKTKELMFDRRLMDEMDTHQSEKEQEQIMREHLARETASEPQPKTMQKEKQQNGPVAGA